MPPGTKTAKAAEPKAKMDPEQHTALWNALCKTDPNYTKAFSRSGGFKGTSINPTYATKVLTETFGHHGFGWGMEQTDMLIKDLPSGEVMVYIQARVWYTITHSNGESEKVFTATQWGGDKMVVKRNDGSLVSDDEALKKAFTDAWMKCAVYIGFASDIHLGLYDDSKYINELKQGSATPAAPARPPQAEAASALHAAAAAGSKPPATTEMSKEDALMLEMNEGWKKIVEIQVSKGLEIAQARKSVETMLKQWRENYQIVSSNPTPEEEKKFVISKQREWISKNT